MKNRIITISREFGSGGRTIGREAAKKLGIPCYDYELIEKIAEQSGFNEKYIAEVGEYTAHSGLFGSVLAGRDYTGYSNQDYLWTMQSNIITEIAQKESCVIVGRCADYILKDKADCLRVFVYADLDKRAERIVQQYGETEVSPKRRLKDKDKRRSAYYQLYTDTKWGKSQNYDITLNSGTLGIDKCVDIIVDLY